MSAWTAYRWNCEATGRSGDRVIMQGAANAGIQGEIFLEEQEHREIMRFQSELELLYFIRTFMKA